MRYAFFKRNYFIRLIILYAFLNSYSIINSQEWQSYWRRDTLKNFSYPYMIFGGWHEVWNYNNCTEERLPNYYCIQSNDTLLVIPTQESCQVDTRLTNKFSNINSFAQYYDSIYKETGIHFVFDMDVDNDIGPGLAYISSHDTLLYCNFYHETMYIDSIFELSDFYLHSSKFKIGPFHVGMNKKTLFSILGTSPRGEVRHVFLMKVESYQDYLIATEDKQKIYLLMNSIIDNQVIIEMRGDTICEISTASDWEKDDSGHLWILYKKGGDSLITAEFNKYINSTR